MNQQSLFCFGHRGARGHEPENTVRSMRRALELGADGVEVDVYFVEGQLVVIHDDTLERTTNGHGRVMEKSFAHLRSLDAGRGEKIPTLAEIFDAVDRRAIINVELKGPHTAAPVVALIEEFVNRERRFPAGELRQEEISTPTGSQRSRSGTDFGWSFDDFLISSFDHEQIREAKRLRPEIRIGTLIDKAPRELAESAEELGAWSLHVSRRWLTAKLVEEAHQRGLKVFVYTVNESEEIAAMRALGVDGVFSDFPERVV
jgi:glycerophosphoryl diester phosphodiesterase